jgi:hypothetical protein
MGRNASKRYSKSFGERLVMPEPSICTEPNRDGECIVARHGSTLPARCAVCNEEAYGGPITMSFDDRRHGGLVGVVIAEAMNVVKGSYYTGPVTVKYYLCKRHRPNVRRRFCISLVVLIAAGIGSLCANALRGSNRELGLEVAAIAAGLAVCSMITLAFKSLSTIWGLKAKKFDDRRVWLVGSDEAFLESLERNSGCLPEETR